MFELVLFHINMFNATTHTQTHTPNWTGRETFKTQQRYMEIKEPALFVSYRIEIEHRMLAKTKRREQVCSLIWSEQLKVEVECVRYGWTNEKERKMKREHQKWLASRINSMAFNVSCICIFSWVDVFVGIIKKCTLCVFYRIFNMPERCRTQNKLRRN